ncbi:MAG: BspA family leucine-rich repeat surface protein, partial [Methylococcales symbiont of Hymedesmia sp. n. MRB-2018]
MVNGPSTCTYLSAGTYTVTASSGITGFSLGGDVTNAPKLKDVMQWGDAKWSSEGLVGAFQGASALIMMSAMDTPDLSMVMDMSFMFNAAGAFTGNSRMNDWDVSMVTNMGGMFNGARNFNQDIGNWVTSSVTDMSGMFTFAREFTQDISGWDVSSITSPEGMTNMFLFARFTQNLGRWYVEDRPTSTTPMLVARNGVLIAQNKVYTLAMGDEDTDNDLFTLDDDVLSPVDTEQVPAGTYNLRIGISDTTDTTDVAIFGTENAIDIRLTSTADAPTSFALEVAPFDDGLTAEAVAAAETQILNAILPQLLRATAKITVDNISNRIDQAFSSSPADTDASLNLGGSSSLQELINNNARTTLQDGLNIKQMFNNSSFLIPLNVAGDNNYGINNITLWGSGDYLSLEDDVSAVDWEGEVIGGSVGIDARLNQNLIAGAALSYSEGD